MRFQAFSNIGRSLVICSLLVTLTDCTERATIDSLLGKSEAGSESDGQLHGRFASTESPANLSAALDEMDGGQVPIEQIRAEQEALLRTVTSTSNPLNELVTPASQRLKPKGPKLCRSAEFAGGGPTHSWSDADWEKVQQTFESVRADLKTWLQENRLRVGAKNARTMEERLVSLKLSRPPEFSQPDLSWRGVGVMMTSGAEARIEMGSGFSQWLESDPKRARFELARTIAMTWTPCMVDAVAHPWSGYLQCMKIESAQCGKGESSEASWAIASAIAQKVAPAECILPAFADSSHSACLTDRLLPTAVAQLKKGN